jgi:ComF family protein
VSGYGTGDGAPGVQVFSAVLFDGLPGELLRRLKFNGEKYLASAVADLIVEHSAGIPKSGDTIVPMPAGPGRLKERGYNQVRLIARKLSSRTGARVSRMLARDDSPSQVGLSTSQRRRNVQGVFHPRRRSRIAGVTGIWLLDDVATTFSTMHSAAMTLLDNGAERVKGLTLAYRRRTAGSIIRSELSRR